MINEVDKTLDVRISILRSNDVPRSCRGDGLSASVDLIEQLQIALFDRIWKRLGDGVADHRSLANQPHVPGIGQLDKVLRALQKGHESGSLLEKLRETLPFSGDPSLRDDLGGGLRANNENAAHSAGRVFVIDWSERIGPVGILDRPVAKDWHQLVLMPGGAVSSQHHLDLGSDDGPDLGPSVAGPRAKYRRMFFRAEGSAIGVVVDAYMLRPPEDEDGMASGQCHADHRLQSRRPSSRLAKWRR